jgi:putative transposase
MIETVRSVKSVTVIHDSNAELIQLLTDFRGIVNEAIRIGLTDKPKNRFELQAIMYQRLKEYHIYSEYVARAVLTAWSILKNRKAKKMPYISSGFIMIQDANYRLEGRTLRIPIKARQWVTLTFRASEKQLALITDPTLKRGSVTITDRTISFVLSKESANIEPLGNVGVDVNERNVTTFDSINGPKPYDISKVPELKENYRRIRARIGERTRQDRRISTQLYQKYGKREKNRTVQALHIVSKAIVENAVKNRLAIKLERLTGIRKLYRKGNGQGASYRGRLNSWTFNEVQRQITYKAAWLGMPVEYVSPRGTSSKCPECDSPLIELEGRRLMCPSCKQTGDRDEIAARNVMAAPLIRAGRSTKGSREGEREGRPQSSEQMVGSL